MKAIIRNVETKSDQLFQEPKRTYNELNFSSPISNLTSNIQNIILKFTSNMIINDLSYKKLGGDLKVVKYLKFGLSHELSGFITSKKGNV
ncbi:hypothetical protein Ahy_B01g052588 isoform D [Arachis hypogaea]|uniref:Uncharacterized protein n=1 Tax=Arachis hypogaea TaxID=3818 RepID=A0A445APU8_ARAHY|nr:hypothetical protein Ahy_B01g052588 isoform D [Arachis hypogaea]